MIRACRDRPAIPFIRLGARTSLAAAPAGVAPIEGGAPAPR